MSQTKTQLVEGLNINTSAPADALAVDNSGRVGIGTTSPDAFLHVAWLSGGPQLVLERTGTATGKYSLSAVSNDFRITDEAQSTERLRIDSSGRLLVGTTTAQGNNRLQLEGSASGATEWSGISLRRGIATASLTSGQYLGAISFQSQGGAEGGILRAVCDANWSASSHPTSLRFLTTESGSTSPTERMRIHSNGNLLLTSATTTADQSIQFGDSGAADRGFFNYRHSVDQMQIGTAGSTRVAINSDGGFAFNSGYGSVGVAYGCRAWVNFQGTATVTIRASGNVASVTDISTGQYRINFSNAMPDDNYATAFAVDGSNTHETAIVNYQNGSVDFYIYDGSYTDRSFCSLSVFR